MHHVSGTQPSQSTTQQQEKDVAANVADEATAEETSSSIAGSRKRKDSDKGDALGERTQETEDANARMASQRLQTKGMQAAPPDTLLVLEGGSEEAAVVLSSNRSVQERSMAQRKVALQSTIQQLELEATAELAAYVSTIEGDLGGVLVRRARKFLADFDENAAAAFAAAEEEYGENDTDLSIMLQLAIRLGEESQKNRFPAENANLEGVGSLPLQQSAQGIHISAARMRGLKERYAAWKFDHKTHVYAGFNAAFSARSFGLSVLGQAGKEYTGSAEDREQLRASITAFQITYANIVEQHVQQKGTQKSPEPYHPGSLFLSEYAKEGGTTATSLRDILRTIDEKFPHSSASTALETMTLAIGQDISAAKSSTDLVLLQELLQNFKTLCAASHLANMAAEQVNHFKLIHGKEVSARDITLGIAELALVSFPTSYNIKNLLQCCEAPIPEVKNIEELAEVEPEKRMTIAQQTAKSISAANMMLVLCRHTFQELPSECMHKEDEGRLAVLQLFETVGTELTELEEVNMTVLEKTRAQIDFPPPTGESSPIPAKKRKSSP